jgi:hypothetical protein
LLNFPIEIEEKISDEVEEEAPTDVQIQLYSPIARVDRSNVAVQVRVSNPQRIMFAKNQLLNA